MRRLGLIIAVGALSIALLVPELAELLELGQLVVDLHAELKKLR